MDEAGSRTTSVLSRGVSRLIRGNYETNRLRLIARSVSTMSAQTSAAAQAQSINDGTIAGYHIDQSYAWHGFVRSRDRADTLFDIQDSTQVVPNGINS